MTKRQALTLIRYYSAYARGPEDVLYRIDVRFPPDGSTEKAMRWLGFCQGVLVERRVFTLEEVKQHSAGRL